MRRLLAIAALALAACSFALNFTPYQCKDNADCISSDLVCSTGVCLPASGASGDSGTDARSETGAPDAGPSATCSTNAQCIARNRDQPYVCRAGACISLTSPSCPYVLGDFASDETIVLGAYTIITPAAPLGSTPTQNFSLALGELRTAGWLPGGVGGARRPLALVLCNQDQPASETAAHLVGTLKVPAVILPALGDKRLEIVTRFAIPNDVLVLSPWVTDSTLRTVEDKGLLWFMNGDVAQLGPSYPPTLSRVEAYTRSLLADSGADATSPVKVALVYTDSSDNDFLTSLIVPSLRFNDGGTPTQNAPTNFKSWRLPSSLGAQSPPSYLTQISEIVAFQPQIIVSITDYELQTSLARQIESAWTVGQRPVYLMGPNEWAQNSAFNTFLASNTPQLSETKRVRFVGIRYETTTDLTNYDAYVVRLRAVYGSGVSVGSHNFYDTMHWLAMGVVAAGQVPGLRGTDIARGFSRMVKGERVDMGPAGFATAWTTLAAGGGVSYWGTLGEPRFDLLQGTRLGFGDIYCFQRNGISIAVSGSGARYDGDAGRLVGTFNCFQGF